MNCELGGWVGGERGSDERGSDERERERKEDIK